MIDFGTHNAILKINLKAIEQNYYLLQEMVGNDCIVAGVCKANAYGTGLKEVVQKLQALGCPQFFVAFLDEALTIRQHDHVTPIAVLSGFVHNEAEIYTRHNITPVLNTRTDVINWQKYCRQIDAQHSAILHIDTAMNRLGISLHEIEDITQNVHDNIKNLSIQYIMSHFASADEDDQNLSILQHERFEQSGHNLSHSLSSPFGLSLANSAGLFRSKDYHYDMVRPGYALYGGNPTPETKNPMMPVVSLEALILQIRECKKGETIGYGASHRFKKDTRTATIALGYGDGFLRHLSNQSTVYYNNQACPVIGRVSMDLTTIDISHIQGRLPQQGDAIEILGPNQTIDDLAEAAGTIGYEILTSLGSRYKRIYYDE